MEKDFKTWSEQKEVINNKLRGKFYHERDVWWCSLGLNIGAEQDGKDVQYKRPVLILKGLSAETCIVLPLTTSSSQHPWRIPIKLREGIISNVILSQIRTIDTRRLVTKIERINKETFEVMRKAVKDML